MWLSRSGTLTRPSTGYRDALGAEVQHRETVERDGVEEALLAVAESYVQLITATRTTRRGQVSRQAGEGLHHVGYRWTTARPPSKPW